jgi:MFS superfamily sulfate permease-like transporter
VVGCKDVSYSTHNKWRKDMVTLATLKFGLIFSAVFLGVVFAAFYAYVMILGRNIPLRKKEIKSEVNETC